MNNIVLFIDKIVDIHFLIIKNLGWYNWEQFGLSADTNDLTLSLNKIKILKFDKIFVFE